MRRVLSGRAAWLGVGAIAGVGLLVAAAAWSWLEPPALELSLEARAGAGAGYAFVPGTISAPANAAVAVTLINASDAPHTLVMLEPIGRRTDVIVPPGQRDRLLLTTPGPGTYRFVCTVHQRMAGSLVVEDSTAR